MRWIWSAALIVGLAGPAGAQDSIEFGGGWIEVTAPPFGTDCDRDGTVDVRDPLEAIRRTVDAIYGE